ncbi:Endo-1,3(4)-beta-glucanase 1 carbohydrate binding domain-containing protein [Madurella fahalii]|uniref:Endo-1,3(4)-beta-glucanase 1 carbohydrate binding domain-containing protein n=1 Tax=Madurella fahalii TaxID=1157608 RepID=A0ABQ0FWJ6_9PEZI
MAVARVLAAVAVAAAVAAPVLAEELQTCGAASYYPSEYTCYDDSALCPVIHTLPTAHCSGSGGCYAPEQFSCEDGTLKSLPDATSPFTLAAFGARPNFGNMTVNACGNYLAIGAGARLCTSCSPAPGAKVQCSEYGNQTVFLPGGQMAADVPGHQYWYVNPRDGALQFTTALPSNSSWNATVPGKEFAGQNVKALENGLFMYTRENMPHYWLACLRTLEGGVIGTVRVWRIYAPIPMKQGRGDCWPVKLVAKPVDKKTGAYKYE